MSASHNVHQGKQNRYLCLWNSWCSYLYAAE